MTKKVFVVIPTIRDLEFLTVWDDDSQFETCHLLIIEDAETKTIKIPEVKCRSVQHYSRQDIRQELGNKAWIIPQKSAAIRSYGFYQAYQQGADVIITLDDDCYPYEDHFVKQHLANLSLKLPENWLPTMPFRSQMFSRGFPYTIRDKRPVVLSHGLWSNVPDLDGITQIRFKPGGFKTYPDFLYPIPKGQYFTASAMNLAFTREIAPLLYQLLMGEKEGGEKWGYERFDDIWAGVFAKKIIDHLNLGAVSGTPFVEHKRASNVFDNILKEASGLKINEDLWRAVQAVKLSKKTPVEAYRELVTKLDWPKNDYFIQLQKAITTWLSLFD